MKIIAETASNHMGEIDYLKKLTREGINNGADFVTFQMFNLDSFLSSSYANYKIFQRIQIRKDKWIDYLEFFQNNNYKIIP